MANRSKKEDERIRLKKNKKNSKDSCMKMFCIHRKDFELNTIAQMIFPHRPSIAKQGT